MKVFEEWQAQNPDRVQENKRMIEIFLRNPGTPGNASRLPAIVTIPIVFHVVLPNPFLVTDADLQAQVDRLNLDYSGLNPDSANIPASFQAVRGHSQLRFVLAKRTPAGLTTNGIERRASSTLYTGANNDPIKNFTAGGLAAWDFTQYFNVWVGTGGGLLGYATFPGTSTASQQGVVTDVIGTASNPCYVDPNYNLGRTLTHEAGHYFGLYHIWGDETACATSDFRNLSGTCIINDLRLAGSATDQTVGDTPNQGDENYGCPSGTLANSCGSPDGDMYQNYMDYTNDACMTMFTALQAERMEWVIANCRAGYLATLGATPPVTAISLDAAPVASINPGGYELNGCISIFRTDAYSCPGSLAPRFRIINNGLNAITSLTVGYRFNNGTPVTQTVSSLNIQPGGTYIAAFPSFAVGIGNHTFRFFTSSPNGNTDQVPSNDTLTQSFRVMALIAVPVFEGFETAAPFTNFTIDNFNGDATWTRTTPGRAGSAGKLTMNNYSTDTRGTFDDLRSTSITVSPTTTYALTFDLAHKYYPQTGFNDTLSVYVSNNCGQTFTRVYQKWGATLATAGSSTAAYNTPAAADWRTESINLSGSLISSGQIVVVFRNSGRYGNNIHIDNINLQPRVRDLRLISINSPVAFICSPNVTPSVTIANNGSEAVSSFNVGYSLNGAANVITTFNQTIAPGAVINITLPAFVAAFGADTITVFTANPVSVSGTGDQNPTNDTLRKVFVLFPTIDAPLTESFEGASFPPNGWAVDNPDGLTTWAKTNTGVRKVRSTDTASVFIRNFNYNGIGSKDDLYTPVVRFSNIDSVYLSFDVAAATYDYPGVTAVAEDTLEILVTKDCNVTFQSVYKKWGTQLQTLGSPNDPVTAEFSPNSYGTNWRRDSVSLLSYLGTSSSFQVVFRSTHNAPGNNIYLDNINVGTRVLPDALKQQGYLVLPTAFTSSFRIWHYTQPTTLTGINVYNSVGQLVWSKRYSGNADRTVYVDLAQKAAGIYFVNLRYTDANRNVTQKVIKY